MKKIMYLLLSIIFYAPTTHTMSVVRNFRIAEITKKPIIEKDNPHGFSIVNLLFNSYQHITKNTNINTFGSFASCTYKFAEFAYFRTDVAFANVNTYVDQESIYSITETDDILFTLCKDFLLNEKTVIGVSGLLGIPTHPIETLQPGFFGYGQISPGLQLDGVRELDQHSKLLYGIRYFYFIPGITKNDTDKIARTLSIGNMVDTLIGIKSRWNKHGIEYGYSSRWIFNGFIDPMPKNIDPNTLHFHVNSFYGVYKYGFKTKRVFHQILFDLSFAYLSKSKCITDQNLLCNRQFSIFSWFAWSLFF